MSKGLRLYHAAKGSLLLGGVVMHGPRRPAVALTFDDGPSPLWTPPILEALRAHRARATFFLLGEHVEAHPELARAVAAEHEVGCHSYAHARAMVDDPAAFAADLARCRELFERVLGQQPRLYRFPWGRRGHMRPRKLARSEGLTCVHWSASAEEHRGADQIVRALTPRLVPGAIVLLHDGLVPHSVHPVPRDETVRALPRVLDVLAERGLASVPVGELLAPDPKS